MQLVTVTNFPLASCSDFSNWCTPKALASSARLWLIHCNHAVFILIFGIDPDIGELVKSHWSIHHKLYPFLGSICQSESVCILEFGVHAFRARFDFMQRWSKMCSIWKFEINFQFENFSSPYSTISRFCSRFFLFTWCQILSEIRDCSHLI